MLNFFISVDNIGVFIFFNCFCKEVELRFLSILLIVMFLFVFGIVVNGVICFVMFFGKCYRKNILNFYILYLLVIDFVLCLFIDLIVVYIVVIVFKIESI